jgi:SAM-dependent methyltransferase
MAVTDHGELTGDPVPSYPVARITCRACGSRSLSSVLDLGKSYIAGLFLSSDQRHRSGPPMPLELVRCDADVQSGACGLVQLRHTVPPEAMYTSYWYRSGINRTMTENLHGIAAQANAAIGGLQPDDLVVDVGCNDGTLLDAYREFAPRSQLLGIDPSDVTRYALGKGHTVLKNFFTAEKLLSATSGAKARIITSIAMFYDLESPALFVKDIAESLAPDGVWISEFAYLPAMLASTAFDGICHEHLEYYSLSVFERLLPHAGLELLRADVNDVNGGSVRCVVGHRGARAPQRDSQAELVRLRDEERAMQLDTGAPYWDFAERAGRVRSELRALLQSLKDAGKVVHGYGASTKGNTILQYVGLDSSVIPCIADRNTDKWGLETVGTHIPIVSEAESRQLGPDYYLTFPWHFLPEFIEREADFLRNGGKFVVPFPRPRIVPLI